MMLPLVWWRQKVSSFSLLLFGSWNFINANERTSFFRCKLNTIIFIFRFRNQSFPSSFTSVLDASTGSSFSCHPQSFAACRRRRDVRLVCCTPFCSLHLDSLTLHNNTQRNSELRFPLRKVGSFESFSCIFETVYEKDNELGLDVQLSVSLFPECLCFRQDVRMKAWIHMISGAGFHYFRIGLVTPWFQIEEQKIWLILIQFTDNRK